MPWCWRWGLVRQIADALLRLLPESNHGEENKRSKRQDYKQGKGHTAQVVLAGGRCRPRPQCGARPIEQQARRAIETEVPQEAAHYLPPLRGYSPAFANRLRMRPILYPVPLGLVPVPIFWAISVKDCPAFHIRVTTPSGRSFVAGSVHGTTSTIVCACCFVVFFLFFAAILVSPFARRCRAERNSASELGILREKIFGT